MRPENSIWQGNFGYWQNSFIHRNLMVIGYTAWKGFMSFGRGVVICNIDSQASHSTITILDKVPFRLQFIPANLIGFDLSWQLIDESMISSISPAVSTYNPHQDIILILKAHPQIEVNFLHNLKITPPDCNEQVCNRWEEFQPSIMA